MPNTFSEGSCDTILQKDVIIALDCLGNLKVYFIAHVKSGGISNLSCAFPLELFVCRKQKLSKN